MRIRTIKPEFFTHEGLFDAEKQEKLPLRIAFIGLWCAADREGRFKWEPRRLGVQILPYDNADFSRVLHALTTRGFVVRYASNGAEFGWIPGFNRHQVINNRESDSQLPPVPQETLDSLALSRVGHASSTGGSRDGHAGQGEGKGREGNMEGKERKGEERFAPPSREELDLAAAKLGLPPTEVDKFVAYYGSNGWKVGRNPMKSWAHALTRWKLNADEHRRPGSTGTGSLTPAERRNSTLDERDVAAVRANAAASAERDRLRLEADPDYNPFYS